MDILIVWFHWPLSTFFAVQTVLCALPQCAAGVETAIPQGSVVHSVVSFICSSL